MENSFRDVMKNRTDGELLEILTKFKDDYQPEAIEAAQQEFDSRNLNESQLTAAKEEIVVKEEFVKEKDQEKLETLPKILFFIFFWGIIPWILARTYKHKGYNRKYKEAWRSIKFGMLAYALLFILVIVLSIFL